MRVLITGVRGLLGTELFRQLQDRVETIGWGRTRLPEGVSPSLVYESVDITEQEKVRSSLDRWRPQVVVHTAAMTDVDACETDPAAARRINADGTRTLAEGCAAVDAFLISVSTDYVFDGSTGRPCREEDLPNPVNKYGRSKLEAEQCALTAARRVVVLRVSGLFGPARSNFVLRAMRRLREGQTVPVVSDQVNSPSYTVDLAEGIRLVIDRFAADPKSSEPGGALHGILHLANSGEANRLEVAEVVAEEVGASKNLLQRTTWKQLGRPARRSEYTALDCSRFERLTGSRLRTWQEAVRGFIQRESTQ